MNEGEICRVVAVLCDFPGLFSVQASLANAVWPGEEAQDLCQDQRTKCRKEDISGHRKATVRQRKEVNLKLPTELNLTLLIKDYFWNSNKSSYLWRIY